MEVTKKNLKEVEKKLREASLAYYNTETKVMSDEDFDSLKDAWEKVAGKRFEIGAAPNVSSTVTLSHSYDNLAGTLDKVNTLDEFKAWLKSKGIKVSAKNPLFVSLKYDGHSINFEFVKNKMKKALTRGQDGVGKDLTGYFKKAWDCSFIKPIEMPDVDDEKIEDFALGFEAVISWKNLVKLNEEFGTSYKNPRSAIGGIIKEDGVPMAKYLTLIPLKYRAITAGHVTRFVELEALSSLNGKIKCFDEMEIMTVESVDELAEMYKTIAETRLELDYMIDGIVVETSDQELREELGYTDNRPNFAIAFKLPYMEKETKLLDMEWYTDGNTATYTPVAVLEPVIMNGATYQKVSLANYRRFMDLKLHYGDRMLFSLNNDVLGYVDKIPGQPTNVAKRFLPPTECTCCGSKLHNDGVFLYCVNEECDLVKIGHLQQFLEKLNVKGIKRNTIKALYDVGIIEGIEDYLDFDSTKEAVIARTEGFGKTSAKQICKAVNDRIYSDKGIYDYELLGSLNIEFLSRDRAKMILRHVGIETLFGEKPNRLEQKLVAINGVGKALVETILKSRERAEGVFKAFKESGVKVVSFSEQVQANQVSGQKYSVVVTGNLKGYSREDFKAAIELRGHKMASSISSKTDFLITNDTSSGTVKNKKALDLGVKIINEEEAVKILGINDSARKKGDIDEAFEY